MPRHLSCICNCCLCHASYFLASLLQEPLLCTLRISPPSWSALGGNALVQAAVRASAPRILLWLEEGCKYGPYARAAAWAPLLLRSLPGMQGIRQEELAACVGLVGWQ